MNITNAEWKVLQRGPRLTEAGLKILQHGPSMRRASLRQSKPRACPSEDEEQIALIAWRDLHIHAYPPLAMLFHPANGGSRHVLEAVKLKKMGVLPGVPDLILLCPYNGYHAWCGEMKALDGKPTPAQRQWIKELRALGYDADIYYGWEAARDGLLRYITGDLKHHG